MAEARRKGSDRTIKKYRKSKGKVFQKKLQ